MGYQEFFAGEHITLMGLGLLGRGVGDAEFLAPLCKELVVTDKKSKEELNPSIERLEQFSNIRYALGGHNEEDFIHTGMVIKAAGVPLDSPYIAVARAAGVPVYMSTALFAKFGRAAGATLVGVTGTRGKSTTTHLIYHALIQAGRRAHLGGTVRGISTLALVPEVQKGDIAVLELDSWQLQGFGDLQLSPDIAVFTNLMLDHLNYYPDMETYFTDKANIFKYQQKSKVIAGAAIAQKIPGAIVPKPGGWNLKILGEHNRENARLAAETLRAFGLSEDEIRRGLESFEPVEGRLQLVRKINGVKIYNDNNATTAEATIAGLKSLQGDKVILIAGGADKNLPLQELLKEMAKCKKVFLLAGSGTDRLQKLGGNGLVYQSIEKVVVEAFAAAEPGDSILFSPGFASFGLFKNEYDRNDQFMTAIKDLDYFLKTI